MKKSSKLILLILTVVICVSLIALTACNDKTSINSKMSKSELKEALSDVSNYTVEMLVISKQSGGPFDDDDIVTIEQNATIEYDFKSNIAHVIGYEKWDIPDDERCAYYEQFLTKENSFFKLKYNDEDGMDVYPWEKLNGNLSRLMDIEYDDEIILGMPNLLLPRVMTYVKMALADPSVKVDGNGWYSYKGTINYLVISWGHETDKQDDSFELKFKVNDKGEIEFSYEVESANRVIEEEDSSLLEVSYTGKITWINKTGSVKKAYDKAKPQIDKDIAEGDY